ncbi:MAG: HepT-like ribonuclease domain-containing protein [Armatimonadota bacterium]
MQRKVLKYLCDIESACSAVETFTAGKSLEQYHSDDLLRSGVERKFEIIGEALGKLLALDPSLEQAITYSKRIISFRNVLIHGYDTVDETVWGVITSYLPCLHEEVRALIGS